MLAAGGKELGGTAKKVQLGPLDGEAGLRSPESRLICGLEKSQPCIMQLQQASGGSCPLGLLTCVGNSPAAPFSCGSSGGCSGAHEGWKAPAFIG